MPIRHSCRNSSHAGSIVQRWPPSFNGKPQAPAFGQRIRFAVPRQRVFSKAKGSHQEHQDHQGTREGWPAVRARLESRFRLTAAVGACVGAANSHCCTSDRCLAGQRVFSKLETTVIWAPPWCSWCALMSGRSWRTRCPNAGAFGLPLNKGSHGTFRLGTLPTSHPS